MHWLWSPVVVHVADEHGVEGVQISTQHCKLIQDQKLRLLGVALAVGFQKLLLHHHLHRLHLQLMQRRQEVCLQQISARLTDDGLSVHYTHTHTHTHTHVKHTHTHTHTHTRTALFMHVCSMNALQMYYSSHAALFHTGFHYYIAEAGISGLGEII